jgi:hypothetical protein
MYFLLFCLEADALRMGFAFAMHLVFDAHAQCGVQSVYFVQIYLGACDDSIQLHPRATRHAAHQTRTRA